jgi:hypothetical protein
LLYEVKKKRFGGRHRGGKKTNNDKHPISHTTPAPNPQPTGHNFLRRASERLGWARVRGGRGKVLKWAFAGSSWGQQLGKNKCSLRLAQVWRGKKNWGFRSLEPHTAPCMRGSMHSLVDEFLSGPLAPIIVLFFM